MISLYILTFLNGCVLLTIRSIYTKLGNFVKLGLLFMTMYLVPHGLKSSMWRCDRELIK